MKRPWCPPYDQIHDLLIAGKLDEALLHYVAELDPVEPSELAPIDPGDDCLMLLDDNLPWAVLPRPLAERILRLLAEGRLVIRPGGFTPNDPAVLRAARARLLPPETMPLAGLPVARRQPAGGYRIPHRFCGALGPKAGPVHPC